MGINYAPRGLGPVGLGSPRQGGDQTIAESERDMTTRVTLTPDTVKTVVLQQLQQLAPEADFDRLNPGEDVRRALDIDSFDFLNLLIALEKILGVSVPEADAGRLSSLDDLVGYLVLHKPA